LFSKVLFWAILPRLLIFIQLVNMSLTERMAPPRCEKGVLPTVRCHKRPGEVCCRFLGAGQAGSGFAGASDNISFLLLWVWETYGCIYIYNIYIWMYMEFDGHSPDIYIYIIYIYTLFIYIHIYIYILYIYGKLNPMTQIRIQHVDWVHAPHWFRSPHAKSKQTSYNFLQHSSNGTNLIGFHTP
jgi:hypothetical protein